MDNTYHVDDSEYITICSLGDDTAADHLVLWRGTAIVEDRTQDQSDLGSCDIAIIADGDHEDLVYRHPETGEWIETTPGDNRVDCVEPTAGYPDLSEERLLKALGVRS